MSQVYDLPLVVVIDDDGPFLQSVAFLLGSVGIDTREFASAEEFLGVFPIGQPSRPGCVLLDVRMPGMSGLELQRVLNKRGCLLPLLIITGHGDVPMAVQALKEGAVDFIEKPFNDQILLEAVNAAIGLSRGRLVDAASREVVRQRLSRLSQREREVLDRVLEGKPNKVIAHELTISVKTVEVHRHAVMEKMEARSVAKVAQQMMLSGILAPAPSPRPREQD